MSTVLASEKLIILDEELQDGWHFRHGYLAGKPVLIDKEQGKISCAYEGFEDLAETCWKVVDGKWVFWQSEFNGHFIQKSYQVLDWKEGNFGGKLEFHRN